MAADRHSSGGGRESNPPGGGHPPQCFEGGRPASTAVRQGPATCALSCTDARSVRPAYGPIRAVPAPFGRKLVESAGPTRALRLQLSAPSTTRSRWAPARVSPSIIGWTYTLNASAPPSL